MRLAILRHGHRLRHRLLLSVGRLFMRGPVPDVLWTLLYRPEFFGKAFSALTQTVLRESEEWTAGECELFAAFVSRKNQCLF